MSDWIQCAPDTMPETSNEILTTHIINGNEKRHFVETESWFWDGEEGRWVWMPKPRPYKD